MELTANTLEELVARVRDNECPLPEIIELALHQLDYNPLPRFPGVCDMIEKLSTMSGPAEVMSLKAPPALQGHIDELLQKNRETGLSRDEQAEWDRFLKFNHVVQIIKIAAARRLKETKSP